MGDRIDGLVDGRELIAPDLRVRPERNVVRRDRHRQQQPLLFGLKVLEGTALRATVAPEPVVIEAPVSRVRARVLERDEHFAGEAVIADAGYGPFDAPLLPGCRLRSMSSIHHAFRSRTPFIHSTALVCR